MSGLEFALDEETAEFLLMVQRHFWEKGYSFSFDYNGDPKYGLSHTFVFAHRTGGDGQVLRFRGRHEVINYVRRLSQEEG